MFDDLTSGTYSVQFVLPSGFEFAPLNAGGNNATDSDADPAMNGMTATTTLNSGEKDMTLDAGLYQPASLGDFVWQDLDADGIQDPNEPGIGAVTVNLLDGNGNLLATTTTAPDGSYQFTGLVPGDYIVEFETPAGYTGSPANQGGDDALDSDADPVTGQTGVISLSSGENDESNDAGFITTCSVSASSDPQATCPAGLVTLSAEPAGGVQPYSYSWNTGETMMTISDNPEVTTTYTVTLSDAIGCTSTADVTVTVYSQPSVDAGDDVYNCGQQTVVLTATGASGTPPYSYFWDNGLGMGASHQVEPEVTTTYTVEVTDANGCTAQDQVSVFVNAEPGLEIGSSNATCGLANGSATADAFGGIGPYSYQWNTGATMATISGLMPGIYTVTATDAVGCQAVESVTIINNGQDPVIAITGGPDCSADLLSYTVSFNVSEGVVALSAGDLVDLGNGNYAAQNVPIAQALTITATSQYNCAGSLQVTPPDCNCPVIAPPTGVEEVYACDDKPVPTLVVFVPEGLTADWYDAPVNGNILVLGSTSYQPTAAGVFWVEVRDPVNGCTSQRLRVEVIPIDCDDCPTPDCLELQKEN
jgi:hypothetical protein